MGLQALFSSRVSARMAVLRFRSARGRPEGPDGQFATGPALDGAGSGGPVHLPPPPKARFPRKVFPPRTGPGDHARRKAKWFGPIIARNASSRDGFGSLDLNPAGAVAQSPIESA